MFQKEGGCLMKSPKMAIRGYVITAFLLMAGIFLLSLDAKVEAKHLENVFQEEAADITKESVLRVSENEAAQPKLTDAPVSTDWAAVGDAFIEITSLQRIGSVYIEWNALPGEWTLSVFDKGAFIQNRKAGQNGFVNESVSIDGSYTRIRISWNKQQKPVSIGRLTLFSKGRVPDTVQTWQPPCEKADMLLVSTHADDEHLYFGGALPTYAGDQAKKVQVAYLINCGIPRTRELLAGLWVVGIRNYPVISSFPDQYAGTLDAAVKIYGYEQVLDYQVMLLRRFRPEVALGHDLNGEYGHGAHILNAMTLTKAITAAKDPAQFPETAKKYGVWEIKKCYLHLYAEHPVMMDWTLPLKAFGGRSGWEMAKLGYAEHISQQVFKFLVRIEGPNDCRKFGLYFTTVGEDVLKNDFFENIPATAVSTPSSDSQHAGPASGWEDFSNPEPSLSGSEESSDSENGGTDGIDDGIAGISAAGAGIVILLLYLLFVRKKRPRK